jgi:hypothetical protein
VILSAPATLETDYLIIGAGAMGMAFADTLLSRSNAEITIVDRGHQPGGHWNTAYSFVRLHQPSACHGVDSTPLGRDRIDLSGWNAGMYELASGGEVTAYFTGVMRQVLLPSGRVRYLPMTEHLGDGLVRSRVAGAEQLIRARRRVVDATYMNVQMPSMWPSPWPVAECERCVPLNALAQLSAPASSYTVIGAGKTGIDACLWLLAGGVDPDAIRWVMPRDSWLLDRGILQPGPRFRAHAEAGFIAQARAVAQATTIDHVFERLVECGQLLRFDPTVWPTMYRCATVTQAELAEVRRIRGVIRLGHVRRIDAGTLVLDGGELPIAPGMLHVDCVADALARRPPVPVFAPGRMTLQAVRTCQQVFSAALLARVETALDDDALKNDLCQPVPHPDSGIDWLRNALAMGRNELRWPAQPELQHWLNGSPPASLLERRPACRLHDQNRTRKDGQLLRIFQWMSPICSHAPRRSRQAEAREARTSHKCLETNLTVAHSRSAKSSGVRQGTDPWSVDLSDPFARFACRPSIHT